MDRRDFIKQAGCGMMGSTTLLSTLSNLNSLNGIFGKENLAKPDVDDYKAIVCVFLSGGIDSFNILIPTGVSSSDNGFNEYKALRSNLAFQNVSTVLPLNNSQCSGFRNIPCNYQSYGIHNAMPEMQGLFNTGKMSFMANIGTLVEPLLNKTEYNSPLKKKPLELYSHSDQTMQWQTSVPQSRDALGFGGRLADIMHASNTNQAVSMNISLNGKNLFQRGHYISEYAISNNVNPNNVGLSPLPTWLPSSGLMTSLRNSAIDSLVGKYYKNALQQTFNTTAKTSIGAFEVFKEALKRVPTFNTQFPANNSLAADLSAIAKVISVRNQLGVKRQIFFVELGGWDMHDDMVNGMNNRLPLVSRALKSFYDATVELGLSDKITTYTISDFARTATSNGVGSDHGWGGNMMVMGGAVNGGRVFGAFPRMDVSASNDRNVSFRGNFIPAVSTDEFYAELALWYGVSPSDLCYVLPNIGNFYTYASGNYPIGYMNMANSPISTTNNPLNCLTY